MRRATWLVVAAVAVVVTALVIGAPASEKPPLDPSSTAPDGTKALVLLLRALGANVDVGRTVPAKGDGVALVLQDGLNDSDRKQLSDWVDGGGRLVVTDPSSSLAGVAPDESTRDVIAGQHGPLLLGRDCPISALDQVASVEPAGTVLLHAGRGESGCYPAGSGFLLVTRNQGSGVVVAIGGPGLWENGKLGEADNSVLAASLLSPTKGTDVTFVGASRVGGGNRGLLGLVSPRLKEALWGLLGAFVLLVLWRARRLGRPVPETLPVELPGSGLVAATGNLFQESRQRSYAASILRSDIRQLVLQRFGVDPSSSDEVAAQVTAARAGIPLERMEAVLLGPPPASDNELLALAVSAAEIRQEVLDAH